MPFRLGGFGLPSQQALADCAWLGSWLQCLAGVVQASAVLRGMSSSVTALNTTLRCSEAALAAAGVIQNACRFAMRRSGNRADAEDITQETFLQVHRSISTYKGRASFSTWIFGIAHHTTCRHFRRQSKNTYSIENEGHLASEFEQTSEERRLDALRALKSCTDTLARSRQPEHMEIFRLFYAENKPIRTIAEMTGRPVDSIKDSLRRSRNLLIRDLPDLKLILDTAHSA